MSELPEIIRVDLPGVSEEYPGLVIQVNDVFKHVVYKMIDGRSVAVHRRPMVTKITVEDDIPGLHCNLRTIKIWSGEKLIAEIPYLRFELVVYK